MEDHINEPVCAPAQTWFCFIDNLIRQNNQI